MLLSGGGDLGMMRPVLYSFSWFEDEPTAPGGGRIRYLVELDGPDPLLGEASYFVNLSEESVQIGGVVTGRDVLILNETDLTRVIDALLSVREALHEEQRRPPLAPEDAPLPGTASVDLLVDMSRQVRDKLSDRGIWTIDDLCRTPRPELVEYGFPKRLLDTIEALLKRHGRVLGEE
jgi:hypothetical protein